MSTLLFLIHTVLMMLITSEVSASSLIADEGSGFLNETKSLLTKSLSTSSSSSSSISSLSSPSSPSISLLPSINYQPRQLSSKQSAFDQDLHVIQKLQPLIHDGPFIQFWRPQKVGSSTILAILLSYSYRYNYLPKRKAGANALCREIAQCALLKKSHDNNNNYHNNNDNPWRTFRGMKKQQQQQHHNHYYDNNSTITTTAYLMDYIQQYIPGSMNNRRSITGRLSKDIKTSMSLPYMMSTGHEICNIHADIIQQHLLCSFQRGGSSNNRKNADDTSSSSSDKKKKINRRKNNKKNDGDENRNDNFLLNPMSVFDMMITDKKSSSSNSAASNNNIDSNVDSIDDDNEMMKELFLVRDPLSRAISVYYFWGELYKLTLNTVKRSKHLSRNHNRGMKKRKLIGSNGSHDNNDDYYDVDYDGDYYYDGDYDGDGDKNEVIFDINIDGYNDDINVVDNRNDNQNDNSNHTKNQTEKVKRSLRYRIGQNSLSNNNNRNKNHHISSHIIPGQYFRYHGIETTSPPLEYAMQYAKGSIYKAGMPGPSFTWSLFSNSLEGSLKILKSSSSLLSSTSSSSSTTTTSSSSSTNNRNICSIILERLDESLVVMSYYLKWSLADVVVIKPRKSLSSHPKYNEWPTESIMILKKHLISIGEYDIYNASVEILDQRIKFLHEKQGVNVNDEVEKLRLLRKRTTEVYTVCTASCHLYISYSTFDFSTLK